MKRFEFKSTPIPGEGRHMATVRRAYDAAWPSFRAALTQKCTEDHNQNMVLRYKDYERGGRRFMWQCADCGALLIRAGKFDVKVWLRVGKTVEPFDEGLRDQTLANYRPISATFWSARATAMREAWFRDHSEYLHTPQWRELRERVIERDGGRCVQCGRRGHHVHHLTYERLRNERLEDLALLCADCHEAVHVVAPI